MLDMTEVEARCHAAKWLSAFADTAVERDARRREAHFIAAAVRTGTYDDKRSPYMVAGRWTVETAREGWTDRDPAAQLRYLRSKLDNFSGYCGEDDAIGDQIRWITRFEYVFRPDLYGADYMPEWV